MVRDVPDAQAILAHQITPALVLTRSGTVVAANDGSVRLLSPFRQNASFATEGSLLGKNIADLALIPLPGAPPVLWAWSAILSAAVDISESGAVNKENIRGYVSTTDLYQNTDDFWDDEAEQQGIIESNVYVARYSSHTGVPSTNDSDDATSMVRARASIRWLSSEIDGVFLIIFNRTSLPYRTAPTSPAAVKDPTNAFERHNDYQSLHSNFHDREVPDECPEHFDFDLDSTDTSSDKTDTSDVAYAIIPHIVATMDTHGLVVKLSKSWYSFSGLNEEQSLGSGWLSIMFPDDVQEMTSAWADVVHNERSHWTHQARYRRASDGTFCWFLIRAEPYRNAKGKVLRWYASMMDIHEWVVARLKADIRRQSIITLFAQTDVMLWGIDKTNQMYICEGRLKWDPNRVVKLLEGARGEQDVPFIEAPEETYRNPDQELVHTIQGVLQGRTFSPIVEHWEDDRYFRTRFVAEHVPPCVDGSATSEDVVQAALALTFDITEEKARSVLLTENKRLVAKEKAALDASNLKSRFLANMSHEIRTPISGIIGLSEHLSDCGLNEEQLEFSNSIEESAKFLLTLINDVLDFSKMESGHMDVEQIPFSPYKLISDTLIPLRLTARERGLALNFRCDLKPDALFLGDPWRLRQILTNLIGNSLKFTQEGHIALGVYEDVKKDNQVIVKFVVKDSGVGISEEAIKPLFKPFSQADGSTARLYGGTGLGLAICRQLVELMGGHISLESVQGESTTATCMIPFQIYHGPTHGLLISTALPDRAKLQSSEEKTNAKKARHLSPTDGTTAKIFDSFVVTNTSGIDNHILLVEDNPINRKVISLALKKLGFVVSAVCDGQEALDYLCKESTEPRPNAILMDCMMPNVDGYEATRRIRNDKAMFNEQVRELPIIALTASAIKGDKERCWDAGMDDYLTKPAARDELRRTLARWLVTPRIRGLDRSRSAD